MIPIPELVNQYYKPPYKFDGYSYIWDANGEMCFMLAQNNADIINTIVEKLLNALNNEEEFKSDAVFKLEHGEVFINGDVKLFIIRGWGRLSSKLSETLAAKVQDTFAQYIVDVLNNKQLNENT